MTTRSYRVATLQRPQFVCPSWCVVSQETHLEDLTDYEGFAFHRSEPIRVGDIVVNRTMTTTVDGTPDPTDEPTINFLGLDADADLPVPAAVDVATAILRLNGHCAAP